MEVSLKVSELWGSSFARLLFVSSHNQIYLLSHHKHPGTLIILFPEHFYHSRDDCHTPKSTNKYATHSFSQIMYHIIPELPYHEMHQGTQIIPCVYISSHSYEYHYIVVYRCQPMKQPTTWYLRCYSYIVTQRTHCPTYHILPSVTYVIYAYIIVIPHVM